MYYYKRLFLTLPVPLSTWCTLSIIHGILYAHTPSFYLILNLSIIGTWYMFKKPFHTLFIILFFTLGWYRYTSIMCTYKATTRNLIRTSPLAGTGTVTDIRDTRITLCTKQRNLHIYTRSHTDLQVGDKVSYTDLIYTRQKDDYLFYLYKEGIHGSLYAKAKSVKLIQRSACNLYSWRLHLHKKLDIRLCKSLTKPTYTLFCALFLGKKNKSLQYHRLRNSCIRWGIVHYLARSGLHVIILMRLWNMILTLLGLGTYSNTIVLLIVLCFYALFSYPSISFIRACLTYSLYRAFSFTTYTPQVLHIISLTTLIVLIINPLHLFFLDFLLSFSITYVLIIIRQITHQKRVATTYGS